MIQFFSKICFTLNIYYTVLYNSNTVQYMTWGPLDPKIGGGGWVGAVSTKSQIYHYKNQKNPYFPQNLGGGGGRPPAPPAADPMVHDIIDFLLYSTAPKLV